MEGRPPEFDDLPLSDLRRVVSVLVAQVERFQADVSAQVNLPGFGKFKVKESPAREGRNPSTGASIQIAASKKVSFMPAKAFKDRLNA